MDVFAEGIRLSIHDDLASAGGDSGRIDARFNQPIHDCWCGLLCYNLVFRSSARTPSLGFCSDAAMLVEQVVLGAGLHFFTDRVLP